MSYQTYITEAIIVGSFDNNTSDKSYLLFTKNAGMLYASARSVREERSKQRFALQDFSHITVSLIKGKTGWRIGSVEAKGNLFTEAHNRAVRGSVVRVCKYLRRFVTGEDPHPKLYEEIILGLSAVDKATVENRALIEELILTRLLYSLGYIARVKDLAEVFDREMSTLLSTPMSEKNLKELRVITASATTASHL